MNLQRLADLDGGPSEPGVDHWMGDPIMITVRWPLAAERSGQGVGAGWVRRQIEADPVRADALGGDGCGVLQRSLYGLGKIVAVGSVVEELLGEGLQPHYFVPRAAAHCCKLGWRA